MLSRVTIIIVSYNSSAVLGRLLNELQAPNIEIIVVDNGSLDESQTIIHSYNNARLIQSHNIGYGRAANLGLAQTKTPYALLLNPDVHITTNDIEKLVACANAHPEIGLLGAEMYAYNDHGEKEITRQETYNNDGLAYTDWLVGAAMLIRMEALQKTGGFDENIFLFYEETDLCKRFLQTGYKLAMTNTAQAEHKEGTSSTPCSRVTKIKYWHAGWSKAYYTRKHSSLLAYLSNCCARLPNTALKFIRASLSGDKTNSLKHYYILRGMTAEIMGKKSFKNGVGRHT